MAGDVAQGESDGVSEICAIDEVEDGRSSNVDELEDAEYRQSPWGRVPGEVELGRAAMEIEPPSRSPSGSLPPADVAAVGMRGLLNERPCTARTMNCTDRDPNIQRLLDEEAAAMAAD